MIYCFRLLICFKSCPREGASQLQSDVERHQQVSSHAPVRGHLHFQVIECTAIRVSSHAPVRGHPHFCTKNAFGFVQNVEFTPEMDTPQEKCAGMVPPARAKRSFFLREPPDFWSLKEVRARGESHHPVQIATPAPWFRSAASNCSPTDIAAQNPCPRRWSAVVLPSG